MNFSSQTSSEAQRFSSQMPFYGIGQEEQNKLKQARVVVCGLEGIGITVMQCLIAAGVGKICIIDDGFITENWLPEQTLFGLGDVGKTRCIAAHGKEFIKTYGALVDLYNTNLQKSNARALLRESHVVVETFHRSLLSEDIMDYLDEYNITAFTAFCMHEKGVFGMYSKNKKEEFRETVTQINNRIKTNFYGFPFCFNTVSSFIGGIMACNAIKYLLGICEEDSELYEFEMMDFNLRKRL